MHRFNIRVPIMHSVCVQLRESMKKGAAAENQVLKCF